jgi:hypothetical protein
VFAIVTPLGEQGGVDVACWASDAPQAAITLGGLREGDAVTIQGKLVRKKDKMLAKVKDGAIMQGDVWVLGVNVVKLRADPAPVPAPRPPEAQGNAHDDGADVPF